MYIFIPSVSGSVVKSHHKTESQVKSSLSKFKSESSRVLLRLDQVESTQVTDLN